MAALGEWIRRVWYLVNRRRFERELEAEMLAHRELMAEPRRFGNPVRLREQAREVWGWRWLEDLLMDLRYGVRQLRRAPSFTLAATATLAIGIGATTTILGQANAVLFSRLPVERADELRQLEWATEQRDFGGRTDFRRGPGIYEYFSYPAYQELRDEATSFSDVLCFAFASVNLTGHGSADEVPAQLVSGNYFRTLGVGTALGRAITPEDDGPDSSTPVAVLSHRGWERLFGADPGVVGRSVAVNGVPFTIIGVAPEGFYGVDPRTVPDLLVPMAAHATATGNLGQLEASGWNVCRVIGRLRPDVSETQAEEEGALVLHRHLLAVGPSDGYVPPRLLVFDVANGVDILRRQSSMSLSVMVIAAGLILLMVSANIAGLLLVRALARRPEIATRLAVGASRRRLVRQMLTETLVLAGLGGTLGIASAWLLGGLIPFQPGGRLPNLALDLGPDARVLTVAVALSLATGVACGLIPALRITRAKPLPSTPLALTERGGRGRMLTGSTLVTLQVGLAMVLLIGTGLFVRTVVNLRSAPLGFDPEGVLVFRLNPIPNGYRGEPFRSFFRSAVERIQTIPGVTSAAVSRPGVLDGTFTGLGTVCVPGYEPSESADNGAWIYQASPGLFGTMRIPLMLGRDFTWEDRQDSPPVAIVNEAFAGTFFEGGNPVGQTMGWFDCPARPDEITIVGVVGNTRYFHVRNAVRPIIYRPYLQYSVDQQQNAVNRFMTVAVRVSGDPATYIPEVRRVLRDLDPQVPMYRLSAHGDAIEEDLQQEKALTTLLFSFAAVAFLLVAVGIYGTLSYFVKGRTFEMGLRMALGARRADLVRMVVRQSLTPVGIGVALGLVGSFVLTRLVQSMLYGVRANDPMTVVFATLLLLVVAAFAASIPARRAACVDPLEALRHE